MTIHRTADGGFRLEGDVDHTLQLIFEALEIAAASSDNYAPDFAALAGRLLEETADWMD